MTIGHLEKYSRLALTAYHLLYSLILSVIISAIIYFIWYPNYLGLATGVLPAVLMLVAINLIIAPLLTFIVYKANKKELSRDLIIILVLQIAALSYGLYIIEAGRPAYLVFADSDFEVVRSFDNEWAQNNSNTEEADAKSLGLFEKPKFVYSTLSSTEEFESNQQTSELTAEEFAVKEYYVRVPTIFRTDSYQPIETAADIIKSKAKSLASLIDNNDAQKVADILRHYPNADSWLPLRATITDLIVLIDETGNVVAIVNLRPQ